MAVFTAALLTIRNRNNLNVLQLTMKMWCRSAVECCWAVKKNDLRNSEDEWLELEKSILR